MGKERSAGAVVFMRATDPPRIPVYLLLQYAAGHWGFPKGHVEAGESDVEAAQREIEEETGIPMHAQTFHFGFLEGNDYSFHRGRERVDKEVVMYLVETGEEQVRLSHEHRDFAWLPFPDAEARLTFDNTRIVLRRAHEFIVENLYSKAR